MLPLLMLPGMMCTAELFSEQINRFSSQRAVHVAPLIGDETVQGLAETVLRQAPPQFALCGLSMGGIVALEVVRQAPERVKGLALLDTNHLAELDDVKRRRSPQMDKVRQGKLLEVMRDEMKPNYLSDGERKSDILLLCGAMALRLGDRAFLSQSIALRDRPDQRATLASVKVPTLILCGLEDRLCPVERHRLMHQLVPGSTLAIIAGAGHLPVLEQPEQTNQYLQDWLDASDARS